MKWGCLHDVLPDVLGCFRSVSTNQHWLFWREIKEKAQSPWRNMAVHAAQVQNLAKLYLKTAYPLASGQLGIISWPSNITLPKQASGELRPRDHDGRRVVFWMHAGGGATACRITKATNGMAYSQGMSRNWIETAPYIQVKDDWKFNLLNIQVCSLKSIQIHFKSSIQKPINPYPPTGISKARWKHADVCCGTTQDWMCCSQRHGMCCNHAIWWGISRKFRMSFVKYSILCQDGSTLVLRSMISSRVGGLDRGMWLNCCIGTWTWYWLGHLTCTAHCWPSLTEGSCCSKHMATRCFWYRTCPYIKRVPPEPVEHAYKRFGRHTPLTILEDARPDEISPKRVLGYLCSLCNVWHDLMINVVIEYYEFIIAFCKTFHI